MLNGWLPLFVFILLAGIFVGGIVEVSNILVDFNTNHFDPIYYSTTGYPEFWESVYRNSIEHFSEVWGKVGPLYFFLIQINDWEVDLSSQSKLCAESGFIRKSNSELKKEYCRIVNRSEKHSVNWEDGNHGMSWSLNPDAMTITMTMSPYRDPIQFVIGPIHEYMHAYQTVYGYSEKAVASNQMGQSLWRGPSWWMEGSATFVSALYCYQNPVLFENIADWWDWEAYSRDLNTHLDNYKGARKTIRQGSTYNDWNLLENENLVHEIIYSGGSIACVFLIQQCRSLQKFMEIFPLIPEIGWGEAFKKNFGMPVEAFYMKFQKFVTNAKVSKETPSEKESWCGFLKER